MPVLAVQPSETYTAYYPHPVDVKVPHDLQVKLGLPAYYTSHWDYPGQVRERLRRNYNLSMIIQGEMGTSKSYFGLKNLEVFDPHIAEDAASDPPLSRVVFTAQDFVKTVKNSPRGSWLLFDEPGLGLSHRAWFSEWNRAVAQVAQSSRFLAVNYLFALPNSVMMDVDVRRISHATAIMRARGLAVIYRIVPNYFAGPSFYTPRLGSVAFGLPSKWFYEAYEEKRLQYHDVFFNKYFKEKPVELHVSKAEELFEKVSRNLKDYSDTKGLNANLIVGKEACSFQLAYKVRAMIQARNRGGESRENGA